MEYTRKFVHRIPIERNTFNNKTIRRLFARELQNIYNDNILYLGETGFYLYTTTNYGYSPKKMKCTITVSGNRGIKKYLICIISKSSLVAYNMYSGSLNTA